MNDTWFQILVIIMSVLLIIILTIVIVIGVKIAKMMKTVKQITDQASNLVGKADHVASFFEKTAAPVAIMKMVANITDAFVKKGNKK
jgi:hypothetical protein